MLNRNTACKDSDALTTPTSWTRPGGFHRRLWREVAKEQGSAAWGWWNGIQYHVNDPNGKGEMREEVWGLFVANTTRQYHPFSLACTCESKIFAQQEFNSYWVMFLVDRQAYTCRISDALAHKCELEDIRPMRGVWLPHGVYFEALGLISWMLGLWGPFPAS